MLTSLRTDRGTEKELIIVTSLDCAFCRTLMESKDMKETPASTVKVLAEFSPLDQIANMIIFKSKDPKEQLRHILLGGILDHNTVEWDSSLDEYNENKKYFDFLKEKFDIQETPCFIVKDKDGTLTEVLPEFDPVQVFVDKVHPKLK